MIIQSAARATVFTRSTYLKKCFAQNNLKLHPRLKKMNNYVYISIYGLTTLNKPKSRKDGQVYTNDGIITQNIFNAAVSTSVELKINTKKLYFCEHLISIRCLLHPGYQI